MSIRIMWTMWTAIWFDTQCVLLAIPRIFLAPARFKIAAGIGLNLREAFPGHEIAQDPGIHIHLRELVEPFHKARTETVIRGPLYATGAGRSQFIGRETGQGLSGSIQPRGRT